MKEILLTQNKVALVDDEDYDELSKYKWRIKVGDGGLFYARRNKRINGKRIEIPMHRQIMNTPKGMEVDHIDHNGLNNQKSNLRNCTTQENQFNVSKIRGKSKYKGVCTYKNGKRELFRVFISINKKQTFIGYYKTEIEAALAYNDAAQKHYGEFAQLNVI